MLKIIVVMLGGVLTGYLFRNKRLTFVSKLITFAIWGLLFLLGIAVGANEEIMGNLNTIGIHALIISVSGVAGSVICARWVYRKYFMKDNC